MLFGDFVLDNGPVGMGKLGLFFFKLFFQVRYGFVFQAGGGFQLAITLGILELVMGIFDFLFQLFYLVDFAPFAFPLGGEFFVLLLQII